MLCKANYCRLPCLAIACAVHTVLQYSIVDLDLLVLGGVQKPLDDLDDMSIGQYLNPLLFEQFYL